MDPMNDAAEQAWWEAIDDAYALLPITEEQTKMAMESLRRECPDE